MVDATTASPHRSMQPERASACSESVIEVAVHPLRASSLEAYRPDPGMAVAPAQSVEWVSAWVREVSPDALVVRCDTFEGPCLLLPLEVVRSGVLKIARLPGGSHANGNLPPMHIARLAAAGGLDLQAISATLRVARPDIDAVVLERLLPSVGSLPNPFASPEAMPSTNIALAVDLTGGFAAVLARSGGKRKRKKHRSQIRKFEAAGGYRRFEAETAAEVNRVLDAFFAMKAVRFGKAGIRNVFAPAEIQSFFRTLFTEALDTSPKPFVLHALEVDGRLLAVTGASRSGSRIVCEFGAIHENDLAHASPGDFLFFDNIREACEDGMDVYDFSVGDEPYKRLWCDLETRQLDLVIPLSAKGRLLAAALRLRTTIKARIRENALLWSGVKQARRLAAPVLRRGFGGKAGRDGAE